MGTRFECVLPAGECPARAPADLRAAGEAALEEIEECHRRFSRFADDSLVSHLARTAARQPVRLDDATFALFAEALDVWRASGGAFDITVAPAMAARGFAASAVPHARSAAGSDAIDLNPDDRTIAFRRDDVALDLGAIAKGHALDRAAACLRRHGVTSAFIHGGTSGGVAIGRPAGEGAWVVAIDGDPAGPPLRLVDRAFSVSDARSQIGRRGARHILDPRRRPSRDGAARLTGATGPIVVTAPSARQADAWSTALVVLGTIPDTFPSACEARFVAPARAGAGRRAVGAGRIL